MSHLIYRGLFYSQKGTSALLCSSSTLLKIKGMIILFYIIVNIFVFSFL